MWPNAQDLHLVLLFPVVLSNAQDVQLVFLFLAALSNVSNAQDIHVVFFPPVALSNVAKCSRLTSGPVVPCSAGGGLVGVWRLFPEVVDVPLYLLASFSAALCNEPFPARRSAPFPYTVAALPLTAVTSCASCAPERTAQCHTISGGHRNSRITTPIGKHHRNVPWFLPPPIPNSFLLKEEYNHCLQGQNRWATKPHDKNKGSGNPHSKNKPHTFKGMHFFHKHSTFSKNYFKQNKNKPFRHLCIQTGPTWTQMNLRLNCI